VSTMQDALSWTAASTYAGQHVLPNVSLMRTFGVPSAR